MESILKNEYTIIKRDGLWIISNLLASSESTIQRVAEHVPITDMLIFFLMDSNSITKTEAINTLANLLLCADMITLYNYLTKYSLKVLLSHADHR